MNSDQFVCEDLALRAESFVTAGVLDWADVHLIDAVAPRFGEVDGEILLGLTLCWRAQRWGHVGVHLSRINAHVERALADRPRRNGENTPVIAWPGNLPEWEAKTLASPMVGGADDALKPFARQAVPGGTLLMTRRMWVEQVRVWAQLTRLCADTPEAIPEKDVEARLARLCAAEDLAGEGADAVRLAVRHALSLVTGGPGTGKTYSIQRLLTLLLSEAGRPLKIELAAPTGKAAVRMKEAMAESVKTALSVGQLREDIAQKLRDLSPRTIHKLLGLRPDGGARHGLDNPLVADVILVDEVSMVDLVLMRHLLEAVPSGCRLVLIGDPDQLASVNAGTVLSDLVHAAQAGGILQGRVARLTRSRRFKDAPTIAHLALTIKQGTTESLRTAVRIVVDGLVPVLEPDPETGLQPTIAPVGWTEIVGGRPNVTQLADLVAPYLEPPEASVPEKMLDLALAEQRANSTVGYGWLIQGLLRTNPGRLRDREVQLRILEALDHYRVLAVHRAGPLGVSGLGRAMERALRTELQNAVTERALAGRTSDSDGSGRGPGADLPVRGGFWLGQAVLVTENADELGVRNGDIGVVLPSNSGRGLAVAFPCIENGERSVLTIPIARLPPNSGALALTVHKSQGSQFKRVAVVLAGRSSPIQTRELIYTAVTRTSSLLDVYGTEDELKEGLERVVGRGSGLGITFAAAP